MNDKDKITLMGNQAQLGNLLWTHFSAKSRFKEFTDLNLAGYPSYFKSANIPFHVCLPRKIWAILTSAAKRILPSRTVSDNLFFLDSMTAQRKELLANIQFEEAISNTVEAFMHPYQSQFVCAIHWRQGDYKTWNNGRYWISPAKLQSTLNDLSKHFEQVHFIICTDGERADFSNVAYTYSTLSDPMADILLMSKCDVLVGSRSTFGAFAAWLGDIPHIEYSATEKIELIPLNGFQTESIIDNQREFEAKLNHPI